MFRKVINNEGGKESPQTFPFDTDNNETFLFGESEVASSFGERIPGLPRTFIKQAKILSSIIFSFNLIGLK